MTESIRIGVDLGGTKIEAIALDEAGEELARTRVDTPREDYSGTVAAVGELVEALEAELALRGTVGLGIPGTIAPDTDLVKNANSTWLIGRPFHRDLEERLGREVRLMNDANCFALSEAVDGAGREGRIVFGVILGTGVGGGIVVDRRVLEGSQLIAGEWGHNPLPWPRDEERAGPECYCGRRGCIETFCSGPGMEADFRRATGRTASSYEIVEALKSGDPEARAALERYVDRLARGLATVINILDPDVVVLGGGMSNLPDLPERTEEALPPYVFTDRLSTRVVRNAHGASSGVRGAAWLWPG